MNSKLTIEDVREALDFDPATGILLWKKPHSNRVQIGDRAGVVAINGRRYINLKGEKHLAHRLAWAHYYGVWPTGDVKQKNGDYDNCTITNLVEQSRQETASNRRVNENSKSGHAGVTWDSKREKWQVHITQDYRQVALGLFEDLDAAVAARQEALATLKISVSPEERAAAAHSVARRRRQRVAWKQVNESGPTTWASFDDFCADIGDIPQTKSQLVKVDFSKPIGPTNFKWSLPPDKPFDHRTREGRIAYLRAHRRENPDLYREKELRRNFGMTLSEYREVENDQFGVCAICGKGETTERDGELLWLAVDHDHDTNENRGLLCIGCNTALGKFNDDPRLLRSAVAYLESKNKREPVWSRPVVTEITHLPIGQKILAENRLHG